MKKSPETQEQKRTLQTISLAELKAIAYDQVVAINRANLVIKEVEAEIAKRTAPQEKDSEPKEPKEKDVA